MIDAKVILDSISETGSRLTTIEMTFHRFVLAEFNTHRTHSRNSASSRAIPVTTQLKKVSENPAFPLFWGSEQKGMQSGDELTGDDLTDAQILFARIHDFTVAEVNEYVKSHPIDRDGKVRLHKGLLNRLLEPFMYHTVIASSTEAGWANFFALRSSNFTKLAQPEIMAVADLAYDGYMASTPTLVHMGEWHTPYIREDDDFTYFESPSEARKAVSVARCARVSYMTHDGIRDIKEDIAMYQRLISAQPPHDSPREHVATPAMRGEDTLGNFSGWHQFRHHA